MGSLANAKSLISQVQNGSVNNNFLRHDLKRQAVGVVELWTEKQNRHIDKQKSEINVIRREILIRPTSLCLQSGETNNKSQQKGKRSLHKNVVNFQHQIPGRSCNADVAQAGKHGEYLRGPGPAMFASLPWSNDLPRGGRSNQGKANATEGDNEKNFGGKIPLAGPRVTGAQITKKILEDKVMIGGSKKLRTAGIQNHRCGRQHEELHGGIKKKSCAQRGTLVLSQRLRLL